MRRFAGATRGVRGNARGFTLLEVILATGIAVGIVAVVLFFYRQSGQLRLELTREAEKISAARLLMDRLTLELRTAQPFDEFTGLIGGEHYIEFVTTQIPMLPSWSANELEAPPAPESDLTVVRYFVQGDPENGGGGIARLEQLFGMFGFWSLTWEDEEEDLEPEVDTGEEVLLSRDLRFLRFRYWDGSQWLNAWDASRLPTGIEITLGEEPPADEGEMEDYPYEQFRRVVYLPGHVLGGVDALDWLFMEDFE
jgi:type II secretory pathway pseudopilin PulG